MSTVAAPPPPASLRPAAIPTADVAPIGACEVCAHALADHDPIAGRYCSATLANALTRGCICPTQAS